MPPSSRAAQELDLLLQEGRADNLALLEGLVHLYAEELFRFAWEFYKPTAVHPTVHRLQARRAVTHALTAALHNLRQFQEQPSTYLWLLRLTYAHASLPTPAIAAAWLHTLSPEELAYILNIPERDAAPLLELPPASASSPAPEPGSAVPPAAYLPLTPAETTALLDHLRAQIPASSAHILPRHTGEFALIGLAIILFTVFVRTTPSRVVYLPTPFPTATATPPPPSPWDRPEISIPITVTYPLEEGFYQPANPYEIWMPSRLLHTGTSYNVTLAPSPANPILAVGDNKNNVALWNLDTFTITQTLAGPGGGIQSLTFSPDGKLLASGGGDGTVYLWEIPAGTLLQVFEGHPNIINDLAFSPDSQTLAVAAGDELTFWQVNSGVKIATYGPFTASLTGVSYAPDGKLLALSEADGTGWLLRTEDVFPLAALKVQDYSTLSDRLQFTPDGRFLVAISTDNLPSLLHIQGVNLPLDIELAKTLINLPGSGYRPVAQNFAFSPDGSLAGVAVEGGTVYLWDPTTWTPIQAPLQTYEYEVSRHQLAFSYDARQLFVTKVDGDIAVWELVDRSEAVKALDPPRFFQRLASDRYQWQYTLPENEQIVWGDTGLANLSQVSEQAGFPIKVPLLGVLDGDHQYTSLSYDPASGIVFASAWAQNNPGVLWGFTLQARKAKPGEWLSPEVSPFASMDKIGLSAVVTPVQVGSFFGEFVAGEWTYLDEENPTLWDANPLPGEQLQVVNRWSNDPTSLTLRWREGEILYELKAYTNGIFLGPVASQDSLILLAQTMFSPEELSLPWNVRLIKYTVLAGDSCTSLSSRFYISEETLRQLNHLPESCLLSRGQSLLLPAPAEPYLTTDLDCDAQEETLLLLHDAPAPDVITGIALESVRSDMRERVWELSASEMGVDSFSPPELFSIEGCEQLLAVSGGTPTDGRTRVFRWSGLSAQMLLNGPGHPYSSDGTVAALPQISDGPFVILLIQYVPATLPSLGSCPNEVTEYTWNGVKFLTGDTMIVSGECAGN